MPRLIYWTSKSGWLEIYRMLYIDIYYAFSDRAEALSDDARLTSDDV